MSTSKRYSASRIRGDSFWTRLSPTARHSACLGLLLVVAVSFYAPMLFQGKAIHASDSIGWRAKANALIEHEEETGEQALWNPNVYSGMPAFVMKYETAVPQLDDVASAARSFAWPVSHLLFLLVGVYLLVFYLTRNHFSGLLSALAFGFTTYLPIILGAGHNTKFIALAFAPFVVLTFVYTLRNPSLIGGLLFAGALAIDLRAKHPQITYSVLMMLLVWWIVEFVLAWREEELPSFAKSTGWLGLGTGLALLMVAQPYLSIYEYKQYSVRGGGAVAGGTGNGGGGGMGWERAMQWSQGPKELLTLVIANAFGGGGQTYWGPKTFTEGPHYVGGVVVALSGLAVWRVRSRTTWGLGAGILFTILLALGKHAAWLNWPMFEYFPFFDAFRAPETWLSVSALGMAILAGIGLDYCLTWEDDRQAREETSRSMLYVLGGVLGLVLLLRVGPGVFFDFEKEGERERLVQAIQQQRPDLSIESQQVQQFIRKQLQEQKDERRSAFTADATRTLMAVGVVLFLLWLYRRESLAAWGAGGLVVLVVLIDLWGVDRRHLGEEQFSDQPETVSQIPTYPFNRFIKDREQEVGGPGHFRVFPLQTPYSQDPSNDAITSYHHESAGGAHPAKLLRYENYLDHVLGLARDKELRLNTMDLLSTRYVLAQQEIPGMEVAFEDEESGTLVLENPDAVPRGFFVGETEVVDGTEATWERLRAQSFDPEKTALLPKALDAPVTPIDSSSTEDVELESFSLEEITWSVETDAPRLFVASEVYYPAGWNAYLNGEQVPIHRVNYLLRGVHVPEGEHTLEMRFEPKSHRYGTWISGVSTVLVYAGVLLLLGMAYRRRKELEDLDETNAE